MYEVTLRTVFNVPQGTHATLKPEKEEFFDIIGELGPQVYYLLSKHFLNYKIRIAYIFLRFSYIYQ